MPDTYKGWRHFGRADRDGDRVVRYTIAFYRQAGQDGEWYDEIRYDSHERRGGRLALAPHLHLKLRSVFKGDLDAAVAEIKAFIDNSLEGIQKVTGP